VGAEPVDYCREIETYLCQKNRGHLIRVVGPSFEMVSRWAADGIPLKVAFSGIDRAVDRYERKGPRRRPLKIDFCEADVLDAFDDWRRAVGLPLETSTASAPESEAPEESAPGRRTGSLPAHLERVVMRLSNARATGRLGAAADPLIDRVARELDAARAEVRGVRGDARTALLARLEALDRELLDAVRSGLDEPTRAALAREADEELADYRARMAPDAFARARDAAVDRLVRERAGLPRLSFS
jgi:hypothetical protein